MKDLDLILSLRTDRSKKEECFEYFSTSPERIKTIIDLASSINAYPLQEYASWILIHVTQKMTTEVNKHQPQLIDAFLRSNNQSVLRNLCNVLFQLPYSTYKESELLDQLLKHVRNPENKVALHVYSIYKLIQFVKQFPELKAEVEASFHSLKEQVPLPPSLQVAFRNYSLKTK